MKQIKLGVVTKKNHGDWESAFMKEGLFEGAAISGTFTEVVAKLLTYLPELPEGITVTVDIMALTDDETPTEPKKNE